MTASNGQIYVDKDPRLAGRRLKVVDTSGEKVVLEVVANPDDIQALLDDNTPGTRSYKPVDRRGKTTKISGARLEKKFRLEPSEPQGVPE